MAILVIYQTKKRSFRQTQLDDWMPGAFSSFDRWHLEMQDWRWQLKKEHYQRLPKFLKAKLPALRRGRKKKDYPSRSKYFTNISSHLAELKRLRWFSRHHDLPDDAASPSTENVKSPPEALPANQPTLDSWLPPVPATRELPAKIIVPKFRKPRIVSRDEFCNDMTNFGWFALHQSRDAPACLFYIFYMNDFSFLDDDELLASPAWSEIGGYLPSDIVKYEMARLLLGFVTFGDYFRMAELFPSFEDHLAINMARHPPSGDRLVRALRAIGVVRLREWLAALKAEFRELGLIKDVVWLWDGVFIEAWMRKERKAGSRNKTVLFGGWYNHGGKKKGFGIVVSLVVDWCGFVPVPMEVEIYPANENDNIVFRDTFGKALDGNPKPALFIDTDKGPSGRKSLDLVASKNMIPVMALGENRKSDFLKTSKKEYKFDTLTTLGVDEKVLERIYMMRTRIEELFSAIKVVFKMGRIHGTGKEFMEVEVLIMTILLMLIALTSYKIGRPDLAWKPAAFKNLSISPEDVFPGRFKELKKYRWVEDSNA